MLISWPKGPHAWYHHMIDIKPKDQNVYCFGKSNIISIKVGNSSQSKILNGWTLSEIWQDSVTSFFALVEEDASIKRFSRKLHGSPRSWNLENNSVLSETIYWILSWRPCGRADLNFHFGWRIRSPTFGFFSTCRASKRAIHNCKGGKQQTRTPLPFERERGEEQEKKGRKLEFFTLLIVLSWAKTWEMFHGRTVFLAWE